MDRLPQSWSDLLPELCGLILRLLPCHLDRLRFRCVCRRWRHAAQQQRLHLPPPLPLVCLNHGAFLSLPGGEARRVDAAPAADVRCHGCFDSWLLYGRPYDCSDFLGHDSDSHKCFLTNPLTGATVEMPLYYYGQHHAYAVSYAVQMHKFTVCSPDLIAALSGPCVVFYRPGAPSWSVSPTPYNGTASCYIDSAFYRGRIYALNAKDDVFVHEVGVSTVEHAIKAQDPQLVDPEEELIKRCHYLVVSCTGKLLMVKWTVPPFYRRSSTSPENFDGITVEVFEAELEKGQWLEVSSLDDGEALFVGRGCSKAVRFRGDDDRFQGNRVYALGRDCFFGYCCDAMPSYGFYDLRDGKIGQVLHRSMRVAAWPVTCMEWFFPLE